MNAPIFPAEWLDVISCCGTKTQLSIISAVVRYQADGTVPDFKGIKLALFRALARYIDNVAPGKAEVTEQKAPKNKDKGKEREKEKEKPRGKSAPRPEEKAAAEEPAKLDPKQIDALTILVDDFNGRDRLAEFLEPYPIPRHVFDDGLIVAIHTNCPSDETMINEDLYWEYIYGLARKVVEDYMASGAHE